MEPVFCGRKDQFLFSLHRHLEFSKIWGRNKLFNSYWIWPFQEVSIQFWECFLGEVEKCMAPRARNLRLELAKNWLESICQWHAFQPHLATWLLEVRRGQNIPIYPNYCGWKMLEDRQIWRHPTGNVRLKQLRKDICTAFSWLVAWEGLHLKAFRPTSAPSLWKRGHSRATEFQWGVLSGSICRLLMT